MTALIDLTADDPLVCRSCLIEHGEMKNMVEHNLLRDFYIFSGVKANSSLGLSELLCTSCEEALMQCRRFRALCQHSDNILKMNIKDEEAKKLGNDENQTERFNKTKIIYDMYRKKLVIKITAQDRVSKIILTCPYQCPDVFTKKFELHNHLLAKHIEESEYSIELQYYCFVENCRYNIKSERKKYFTGRKYVNQHYNKVHGNRSIMCNTCRLNFLTDVEYDRHMNTCNYSYKCDDCDRSYKTKDRLLVHTMRNHPLLHQQYKNGTKVEKRKSKVFLEAKKTKVETECTSDSPKRSSATQTLKLEQSIRNDVTLPLWPDKNDGKTDEISTQTVFEDLMSLKSQASEDDSIYYTEAVALSDIHTQTFPVEFGLSRCNKQTITSETQSPDLSIKETQTCPCLYDSPKFSCKLFDSATSSPVMTLTSTETQTADLGDIDAILAFNTAETQTSFEDNLDRDM